VFLLLFFLDTLVAQTLIKMAATKTIATTNDKDQEVLVAESSASDNDSDDDTPLKEQQPSVAVSNKPTVVSAPANVASTAATTNNAIVAKAPVRSGGSAAIVATTAAVAEGGGDEEDAETDSDPDAKHASGRTSGRKRKASVKAKGSTTATLTKPSPPVSKIANRAVRVRNFLTFLLLHGMQCSSSTRHPFPCYTLFGARLQVLSGVGSELDLVFWNMVKFQQGPRSATSEITKYFVTFLERMVNWAKYVPLLLFAIDCT
jgi:hypothetical protein